MNSNTPVSSDFRSATPAGLREWLLDAEEISDWIDNVFQDVLGEDPDTDALGVGSSAPG